MELTPIVSPGEEVARVIEAVEAENDRIRETNGFFMGQHAVVAPIFIPTPTPQAEFEALQKWEGHVVSVARDEFAATLIDLTQPGIEEEAVLELSEVTDDDLTLVQPGAIFYWSIGYRIERSGERSRSSVIWFRRLPAWTKNDVERAEKRASELRANLGF